MWSMCCQCVVDVWSMCGADVVFVDANRNNWPPPLSSLFFFPTYTYDVESGLITQNNTVIIKKISFR